MEYKQWLSKELDKALSREDTQMLNFQDTGNSRYERARLNAEYLARALSTALKVEGKQDEVTDQVNRRTQGFLDEMDKYIETLPPDLAVKKIKDIITFNKMLLNSGRKRGQS